MYLSKISSVSKKCPSLSIIIEWASPSRLKSTPCTCTNPSHLLSLLRALRNCVGIETRWAGVSFDAVFDMVARHEFRIAHAHGLGVDYRHAEMGFQLLGGDHIGINLAAQGNYRLSALSD